MGSNAEKPGITWNCGGKRSATTLSPAFVGKTSFADSYKEQGRGPSEGGCGVEARGVGAPSRRSRPAGAHGWVGAVGPVVPLRSTTG